MARTTARPDMTPEEPDAEDMAGSAVLVHDAHGTVLHVHREVVLRGGAPSSPAELMVRAVRLAKVHHPGQTGLLAFQVARFRLKPGYLPRVDVQHHRLIWAKATAGEVPRKDTLRQPHRGGVR